MGIFSSKYKTTVGTSITRVIEDSQIPNSVLTGVTKSLMQSDGQLLENAMEELIGSIGVRANRMYDYGRKTYPHGVPKGTLLNSKSGKVLVEEAIEFEHGPVTMDYYYYGPLNNLHFGWLKLQDTYQYNSATNQLVVNGATVYLVDMVVNIKEATLGELANGSLDQWGISPKNGETAERRNWGSLSGFSMFELDALASGDYLKVTYNSKNAAGIVDIGTFNIPVTGVDITADYHHACYMKTGARKYWLYKANAGVHQAIDVLHSTVYSAGGSYMPWGYFRYNKVSTVNDVTTNEYKTSKRLMNYIGLDFETVGKTINENPDIADVEQAMLMMAVPANSTKQIDVRYLYDFFGGLYSTQISTNPALDESQAIQDILRNLFDKTPASSGSKNSLVIQDAKFKMTLDFRRITKARRTGVLGKIGTYQGGYGTGVDTVKGLDDSGLPITHSTTVKHHFYRRQVTAKIFEEIRVEGLTMKYHIFEDYYETADEAEDILLIPIDMAIVDNYSIMDREVLYCRSLHYVFNSRVITKIKWYQQSFFKYLMIVVAIVATLVFNPIGGAIWAAIASGSAVAITTALVALAVELLAQFLISMVIKLFVKLVGGKFAFILAIVAVLYTGYTSFQSGSVNGAPFATELLKLSSNLAEASFSDIMKGKYQNLEKEYNEFSDMVSSNKEKLERAKSELGYNNYLTPAFIFGETPSEFYDRTIHSGNIGVLAIDAISSYYDIALSLPKPKHTLGDE